MATIILWCSSTFDIQTQNKFACTVTIVSKLLKIDAIFSLLATSCKLVVSLPQRELSIIHSIHTLVHLPIIPNISSLVVWVRLERSTRGGKRSIHYCKRAQGSVRKYIMKTSEKPVRDTSIILFARSRKLNTECPSWECLRTHFGLSLFCFRGSLAIQRGIRNTVQIEYRLRAFSPSADSVAYLYPPFPQ